MSISLICRMVSQLLIPPARKSSIGEKKDFIFYRIVGTFSSEEYILQCINTNALFRSKTIDMVFDPDILHGLHPIQACYIGLRYSSQINQPNTKTIGKNFKNEYLLSRYGKYRLVYENRSGELSFTDSETNTALLKDPRDIALSEELISEFDAAQAFYIGLTAGIKIDRPGNNPIIKHFSHLTIIK